MKRPLENGRFVEQNDSIATFPPLFVIDFVGNAKGQWNIGKCLNMPASVRTAEQMPLWNTVQSPFFNWRHSVSRVNFPCHTIHSQSMSLVNVYSPWSLVNTYVCARGISHVIRKTVQTVKLFSYILFVHGLTTMTSNSVLGNSHGPMFVITVTNDRNFCSDYGPFVLFLYWSLLISIAWPSLNGIFNIFCDSWISTWNYIWDERIII